MFTGTETQFVIYPQIRKEFESNGASSNGQGGDQGQKDSMNHGQTNGGGTPNLPPGMGGPPGLGGMGPGGGDPRMMGPGGMRPGELNNFDNY